MTSDHIQSNKPAVLLIHGFTGGPSQMAKLSAHIESELGWDTESVMLAGHENDVEGLAKTRWPDWYQSVESAFLSMRKNHSEIYIAGISLGGLLSLKLSLDHPSEIKGVVSMAAPLQMATWIRWAIPIGIRPPISWFYKIRKKGGMDVAKPNEKIFSKIDGMPLKCVASLMDLQKIVRDHLRDLNIPALFLHGERDTTAPMFNFEMAKEKLQNKEATFKSYPNSAHQLTIDYDRDQVFEDITNFLKNIHERQMNTSLLRMTGESS
jgi:carboxylesterase